MPILDPRTAPYPTYPVPPVSVTPPTGPNAINDQMSTIVNGAIPGYNGLSKSASSIVGNLLGGQPSASPTQRENAYFGEQSGMPNSDFVRNRGFDLYGEKGEQYKQRGFDDFLKLLTGTIGTVTTTPGQQIQQSQFDRSIQLQQQEANQRSAGNNADYALKAGGGGNPQESYWTDRMGARHIGHAPNIV